MHFVVYTNESKSPNGRIKLLYSEIVDLKASKYVGTQEAWSAISKALDIEESPKRVALLVNDVLKESNVEIVYEATAQRVLGLITSIYDLLTEWNVVLEMKNTIFGAEINFNDNSSNETKNDQSDKLNSIDYFENKRDRSNDPILRYMDSLLFETNRKLMNVSELDLSKRLVPLFLNAQNPKMSDRLFGYMSTIKILSEIPLHGLEKETLPELAKKYPWGKAFSNIYIEQNKRKFILEIYSEFLKINERVLRALNDQVDHKLEIRREILTDYIQNGLAHLSYDDILLKLKTNCDSLIAFYKNYADQISDDEDGKLVKMQYLNIIRYQKYLLTCLAPEKRFIEKFLRN